MSGPSGPDMVVVPITFVGDIHEGRVLELVIALLEAYQSVPAQFRKSVTYSTFCWSPATGQAKIALQYERPETAAEFQDREASEAARRQEAEERERSQYERLKAKFERAAA